MSHGLVGAAAALLLVGCGATDATVGSTHPSPAPSPRATTVDCSDATVSLTVAQTLTVDCGADMGLRLSGTALRQTGPDAFRAVAAGTASIVLTGGPVCSPGTACPQYRIEGGVIVVTVR